MRKITKIEGLFLTAVSTLADISIRDHLVFSEIGSLAWNVCLRGESFELPTFVDPEDTSSNRNNLALVYGDVGSTLLERVLLRTLKNFNFETASESKKLRVLSFVTTFSVPATKIAKVLNKLDMKLG